MSNPDPWGYSPVLPNGDPVDVNPRLDAALSVLPRAEREPGRFLSDLEPRLCRLAEATLCLYADMYGRRVTSQDTADLRKRVTSTVWFWATGRGFRNAIQWENHRGDVRQAYLIGDMHYIREAVREWVELLVVSILAGGVVTLEEVR